MKLPHLTNSQAHEVAQRAELPGIHPDQCPTCDSTPDEYGERVNGTYKFRGKSYECNCEEQVLLRKHYALANIPDQYMKLDWEKDYTGSEDARIAVAKYLEMWPSMKANGVGLEFASRQLGTGKTFAATHIGKELIKRRERVYFIPFNQMLDAMRNQSEAILSKLDSINIVILDEVRSPPNNDQIRSIFADRFESIIRNRTNYNGITIMTTNMTEKTLDEDYPRVYSLLSAKQIRVQMNGHDVRSNIGKENSELALNGERRPIV